METKGGDNKTMWSPSVANNKEKFSHEPGARGKNKAKMMVGLRTCDQNSIIYMCAGMYVWAQIIYNTLRRAKKKSAVPSLEVAEPNRRPFGSWRAANHHVKHFVGWGGKWC
jgi:hypothetical protein